MFYFLNKVKCYQLVSGEPNHQFYNTQVGFWLPLKASLQCRWLYAQNVGNHGKGGPRLAARLYKRQAQHDTVARKSQHCTSRQPPTQTTYKTYPIHVAYLKIFPYKRMTGEFNDQSRVVRVSH